MRSSPGGTRLGGRVLLAWLILAAALDAQAPDFDDHFLPRTLRLDYHHGGTVKREFLSLDALREEPLWAGRRRRLVDPIGRGRYQVRVRDRKSGRILYSQGYDTVFGEWQTTVEAKRRTRVFNESVSLPYPRRPVEVAFFTRDRNNAYHETFAVEVDPDAVEVRRDPPRDVRLVRLLKNGPPSAKVDVAVVAEGYRADQMATFEADARRLFDGFFAVEPMGSRKKDFNVTLVCAPSEQEGIDEPLKGKFRRTAVEASFNAFGLPRYVLVMDYWRLRDLAAAAPHDRLVVLVNSDRYGGGGIYNWYLTTSARNEAAAHVLAHEFGHAIAGLADEYYSSQVAYDRFYPPGVEPQEPNITRLLDPTRLKWRSLLEAGTPVPTPWPQTRYDALVAEAGREQQRLQKDGGAEAVRALQQDLLRRQRAFFRKSPYAGKVGAYEGGGYVARGIYRPALNCIMFSRAAAAYCPVCERAIGEVIDILSRE